MFFENYVSVKITQVSVRLFFYKVYKVMKKQSKNTVCFINLSLIIERKVQLYSRLKKTNSFCFSRLIYLFNRFFLAAGCYFDP